MESVLPKKKLNQYDKLWKNSRDPNVGQKSRSTVNTTYKAAAILGDM